MLIQWGHFKGRSKIRKNEKLTCDIHFPIFEMPPLYYLTDQPVKDSSGNVFKQQLDMTPAFSSYAFLLYLGGLPEIQKKTKNSSLCNVKPESKQTSDQQAPSICLMRNLALAMLCIRLRGVCQHKCTHDFLYS